jgi:plastocyanin
LKRSSLRGIAALSTALVLAACSGGTTPTSAPTAGGPAATTAAAPCTDSTGPTTVSASAVDNTWAPADVTAKVGDVITWSNGDGVPHKVALDDGSCQMSANISAGSSASLVFSVAGTFPFHCSIHPSMKGTITIS